MPPTKLVPNCSAVPKEPAVSKMYEASMLCRGDAFLTSSIDPAYIE